MTLASWLVMLFVVASSNAGTVLLTLWWCQRRNRCPPRLQRESQAWLAMVARGNGRREAARARRHMQGIYTPVPVDVDDSAETRPNPTRRKP